MRVERYCDRVFVAGARVDVSECQILEFTKSDIRVTDRSITENVAVVCPWPGVDD